jgi:hypothetical protein
MNEAVVSVPYERTDLGRGAYLVSTGDDDLPYVLHSKAMHVLERCDLPRSVEEHATRLREDHNLALNKPSQIDAILRDLLLRGLLVPLSRFSGRGEGHAHCEMRVSCFALVTANRPQAARRALRSYWHNFETYGHTPEVLVVDDSRSDEARSESLGAIRGRFGDSLLRYAGTREKEAFVQILSKAGIAPEVGRFALLGDSDVTYCGSPGSNRNAALLDTQGNCVLMADDDTVCQLGVSPNHDGQIEFTGHNNPRNTWFYGSRDKLKAEARWISADILGQHARLLGSDIQSLVHSTSPDSVRFGDACRHLKSAILGTRGRIIGTMSGVAGDCGAYSTIHLLTSNQEVRQRLCGHEEVFDTAFNSREVLSVADRYTVTHYSFCHSTTLGLANYDILPPFFPIGANEDGVFGSLISLTAPGAFWGHVPVAVLHDTYAQGSHMSAISAGAGGRRRYTDMPEFRLADLVLAVLGSAPVYSGRDIRGALRHLGQHLNVIAAESDSSFWAYVFTAVKASEAQVLRRLDTVEKSLGHVPPYWTNAVSTVRDHVIRRISGKKCPVPAEVSARNSEDEARSHVKELVRCAGLLLCSWPDIVDATRSAIERGERLSREATSDLR